MPPFALNNSRLDALISPMVHKQAAGGGNPFGAFYVGAGNIAWPGKGEIATPPIGYQAGDILYTFFNGFTPYTGYAAIATSGINDFGMCIRVADGTSADNIAAAAGGFVRQIFATRNNAEFTRSGSFRHTATLTSVITNMPFPANTKSSGAEQAAILFYVGTKLNLTTAATIDKGDADIEITGKRITTGILGIMGVQFQLTAADTVGGDFNYSVVESSSRYASVFRQRVNVL